MNVSKKHYITIGTILLGFFIIGSFFDFQISQALFNLNSVYGNFFAAFGELPALLGFVFAGSMLIAAHSKEKPLVGAAQCLGGGLVLLLGTLMTAVLPGHYLTLPGAVTLLGGIALSAAVAFWGFSLGRKADRKTAITIAGAILLVLFAEMVLVNLIKIPWGRARMRLVATNPAAYFMPWWQAGDGLKTTLVASGVAAEEFKSFPSGHTANAASFMMLCFLPMLSAKIKLSAPKLLFVGAAWGFLVALSRIIMGAHYLTDTVVGFAVTFLVMILVKKFIVDRKIQPCEVDASRKQGLANH